MSSSFLYQHAVQSGFLFNIPNFWGKNRCNVHGLRPTIVLYTSLYILFHVQSGKSSPILRYEILHPFFVESSYSFQSLDAKKMTRLLLFSIYTLVSSCPPPPPPPPPPVPPCFGLIILRTTLDSLVMIVQIMI